MTTEQRLQEVFRAVFNLSDQADATTVEQGSHAGWDSMAHVTLMGAIESEFSLSVDVGDSIELTSFHAVLDYVNRELS